MYIPLFEVLWCGTWREIEHYKHYLPKICELIATQNFSYVTLYEFYLKLKYANCSEWPEDERQGILDYVIADWIDSSNHRNSEIRDRYIEVYNKFLEVSDLLRFWEISKTKEALRNFVYFFYFHGSQIFNHGLRISGKKYIEEFVNWIQIEDLIAKLELRFFENEQLDPDYADKISVVIQIIEQERKIK